MLAPIADLGASFRAHHAQLTRERKRKAYREWSAKNRERLNEYRRNRRKENPELHKAKQQRRWALPEQRLSSAMRSSMRRAIKAKSDKNYRPWENLVGYTRAELISHIERQFLRGMSWDNFGKWHIDHIIPVAAFRFQSVGDPEFKACWALTNLRPMWGKANNEKNAKRLLLI